MSANKKTTRSHQSNPKTQTFTIEQVKADLQPIVEKIVSEMKR